jgi:cysteine desulfurase/selenocysteine lyase
MSFDVDAIRAQFPILQREIDGAPLVYLDNAATTQKPQCVIDALTNYYSQYNSNVHRGAHQLADEATRHFEAARDTIAQFINASAREEVIWTSGTTDAINLVANGLVQYLNPGDEIVVTEMEHHANLVPWQQACQRSGAILKIAPVDDSGALREDAFTALLGEKTRLVAFSHVSNALGTVNPVKKLCQQAKAVGAWVLVDGAQGIAHGSVDVQNLGCDFYAFSGHKLFGPTGIGVLWGRQALLADWPVWKTGGEMIATVSYQNAEWNTLPYKFEAGTPHIAGAIGMAAAVNWFSSLDMAALQEHEAALLARATEQAEDFEGLRIIGSASHKIAILSFIIEGSHSSDIGFMLDRQGIAVRTGHHCAEPLMARYGITGTARASFSLYNTIAEVDILFSGLQKVKNMLQ